MREQRRVAVACQRGTSVLVQVVLTLDAVALQQAVHQVEQPDRQHCVVQVALADKTNTLMGLIALREENLVAAKGYLRESANVLPEDSLCTEGPSLSLAKALCVVGQWGDVAAYLRACPPFWPEDKVQGWISQVEREELPSFPNV